MGKGSRQRPCSVPEEERRANWDLIFGKNKPVTGLPEQWTKVLLGFPESGMGYQSVIVTLKDGSEIEVKVFNGTECAGLTDEQTRNIVDVRVV